MSYTTPLVWTMQKRKPFSGTGVFFLLFLLLLSTFLSNRVKSSLTKESRLTENVFVQAAGRVKAPGVYGFMHVPSLEELIDRAGGLMPDASLDAPKGSMTYNTGSRVVITRGRKQVAFTSDKMSPFYRLTLGIPISINTDTALGLTAVPGIGPKTAAAIVSARERAGGFTQLEDLLTVRGISPSLYGRISPYLTL